MLDERRYCHRCWFFGVAFNCIDCLQSGALTPAGWRVLHPISAEVQEEHGLIGAPGEVYQPIECSDDRVVGQREVLELYEDDVQWL